MRTQTVTDTLSTFNRLVLTHQEQAFNLACFLLDDDRAAEQATQDGVLEIYRQWSRGLADPFQGRLLACVARACQTYKNGKNPKNGAPRQNGLSQLSFEQRLAVTLVDALGLKHTDAAGIAGWPVDRFRQALAEGRRQMACVGRVS